LEHAEITTTSSGQLWLNHDVLACHQCEHAGTSFGVLFLSMNIGGGVLVWMRESAELRAQPQQTPFWMLESRGDIDVTAEERAEAQTKKITRPTGSAGGRKMNKTTPDGR
jgi:hypothetical protein